ncbi:type IV pilus biogenesis/stability protein PilW [Kordia sp. SMS9]|uniref:hypothetical protein n=1 Tax=Kordia sp. SMS9 TaxID=2282170 RepID=UPI000E0D68D1|nr:hypothetical protein [Kordia sp. SMS9]AXG70974.1 type IV pilus biogenesis/stability protein PilW [Kordia sp. SMS9]
MDFRDEEDMLFDVDNLIEEGAVKEAKALLYKVLENYPDYSKAHNHLGWIYHYKMLDYEKAEMHYKLAVKFAGNYHSPYHNYAYLLIDKGYNEEMLTFGEKALQIKTVDESIIFSLIAKAHELNGDFFKAYSYYKKAKQKALRNDFIKDIDASLQRLHNKMSIFQKLKLIFK